MKDWLWLEFSTLLQQTTLKLLIPWSSFSFWSISSFFNIILSITIKLRDYLQISFSRLSPVRVFWTVEVCIDINRSRGDSVIVLITLLVWFFLLNPEFRIRLTEPDTSGTHSLCLRIRPSAVGWTGVRAGQTSLRTGTQLTSYIEPVFWLQSLLDPPQQNILDLERCEFTP